MLSVLSFLLNHGSYHPQIGNLEEVRPQQTLQSPWPKPFATLPHLWLGKQSPWVYENLGTPLLHPISSGAPTHLVLLCSSSIARPLSSCRVLRHAQYPALGRRLLLPHNTLLMAQQALQLPLCPFLDSAEVQVEATVRTQVEPASQLSQSPTSL